MLIEGDQMIIGVHYTSESPFDQANNSPHLCILDLRHLFSAYYKWNGVILKMFTWNLLHLSLLNPVVFIIT